MKPEVAERVLKEITKRYGDPASYVQKITIDFNRELTRKQYDVIADPSKRKAVLAARRSGKSHGMAYYLVKTCYETPGSNTTFVGLTRQSAKDIMWDYLKDIDHKHSIKMEFNETNLIAMFPNGSRISITGVGNLRETRKHLGKNYDLIVMDECNAHGSYLERFIKKVLMPTLMDNNGTICLVGTPGIVCAGYWYNITKGVEHNWRIFSNWTVLDNPKLPRLRNKADWKELARGLLNEVLVENNYTEDHPVYRREYLGEWVEDSSIQVYRFKHDRNTFTKLPKGTEWNYIISADFGIVDSTAIIVGAYSLDSPILYIVECYKENDKAPSDIAHIINDFNDKYMPVAIVADLNGQGKAFEREIQKRYQLPIVGAEKINKVGFISMMNDDLLSGKIKIRYDLNEMIEEFYNFHWKDPTLKILSETGEDHTLDALLYLWRKSAHYIGKKPKAIASRNSEEYMSDYWKRHKENMIKMQREYEEEGWLYD